MKITYKLFSSTMVNTEAPNSENYIVKIYIMYHALYNVLHSYVIWPSCPGRWISKDVNDLILL